MKEYSLEKKYIKILFQKCYDSTKDFWNKYKRKLNKKKQAPNRGVEPRATRITSQSDLKADDVSRYTNSDDFGMFWCD